jgi:hypothetical protein
MLVPHEPEADPRIGWVADLCTPVAETLILGATWSTERPALGHRGTANVVRVYIPDVAAGRARALGLMRKVKGATRKRADTPDAPSAYSEEYLDSGCAEGRLPSRLARFSSLWVKERMRIDALYRRGRAEPNTPNLIVCHDLPGLVAGVRLKKLLGVPLLYDAHEYWPQADLLQEPWPSRY